MKTQAFIFVGLLLLSVFSFSSCKKCKVCTSETVIETPGFPNQTSSADHGELCGDDLEAVDGKTASTTEQQGQITITSTTTYTCVK